VTITGKWETGGEKGKQNSQSCCKDGGSVSFYFYDKRTYFPITAVEASLLILFSSCRLKKPDGLFSDFKVTNILCNSFVPAIKYYQTPWNWERFWKDDDFIYLDINCLDMKGY